MSSGNEILAIKSIKLKKLSKKRLLSLNIYKFLQNKRMDIKDYIIRLFCNVLEKEWRQPFYYLKKQLCQN